MLTFLSQKLKFILVFVLVIIGISFVFFGDWSGGGMGVNFHAKIKGRPVTLTDFQNSIRATRVAYTLGTGQIPDSSDAFSQAISRQAWNRLMILAEVREAGLTADSNRVQEEIRKHPLFQDPQKQTFSPETFKRFQDFVLTPQGITLERFLEIMRDQILIDAWLESLQQSAVVQPSEINEAFANLFAPVNMDYIQINPQTLVGTIETNEQLLRAFYEKRTERFSLPEQRKVDYILLKLPATVASQPAEAQAAARRELGEKAYQFTEPFYTALENNQPLPDFNAQARAAGLEVQTSPYFARDGFIFSGPTGSALAQQAFTLTPERPVSDYVQVAEGYAILRLREIQPAAVRPFESVRDEVKKAFMEAETELRTAAGGESLVARIKADLAAGKTFAQAAAAAGQKPASLAPFMVAQPDPKASTGALQNSARFRSMQLQPGQITEAVPLEGKLVVFHLASRGQPDPAKQAEVFPRLKEQLLQQRRSQLRDLYLARLGESKGTTLPANLFAENAN